MVNHRPKHRERLEDRGGRLYYYPILFMFESFYADARSSLQDNPEPRWSPANGEEICR